MSRRKRTPRDRHRPLKVFVDERERAFIVESARIAGLSVSMYLRTVGMHGRPTSILDHEAVRAMIRAHGDLARLGGLLKLWLSEHEDHGAPAIEVRSVLHQIEAMLPEARTKILGIKVG